MKISGLLFSAPLALSLLAGGIFTVTHSDDAFAGKARGHLYSTSAVNRFCRGAQQIIANTDLESTNVLYDDLGTPGVPFPVPIPATGFIGSDALPYDGAEDLPLTSTQYIGFGYNLEGKDYPQTIMCKMKSWDALDFYNPGSAAPGANCSDINRDSYQAVKDSLVNMEIPVINEVIFDDWITYTGQQWTSQAPAVTAYTSTVDGMVHIVAKPLYVARLNFTPFIPPQKKGVHYCQIIAPEYLREVITGGVTTPTCDAPPTYLPPAGPPSPPPLWDCQNP
jgi:hypothetical protein